MSSRLSVVALALLAWTSPARAGTVYVAGNGADGAACGAKASPCRSITRGIANAMSGDRIVVGPGHYGVFEETPAPGCACMLAVNKPVRLESSHGAAQTTIDGRGSGESRTVLVIANGVEFGRAGHGFLVTQSGGGSRGGMVIDADAVEIKGSQFVEVKATAFGTGVGSVSSAGKILFEGNQVIGWSTGVSLQGPNKTIRKNAVSHNSTGIVAPAGSAVIGNAVADNTLGIFLTDGAALILRNGVVGNSLGISNLPPGPPGSGNAFTGTLSQNDLVGNSCGVRNDGIVGLVVDDHYWGSPTGPGPAPADNFCNSSGGTTIVPGFATGPFRVKPTIKP